MERIRSSERGTLWEKSEYLANGRSLFFSICLVAVVLDSWGSVFVNIFCLCALSLMLIR